MDDSRMGLIADKYLNKKFIFVMGSMSSGTTLMRYILDVHPEINCGDETKIVHILVEMIDRVYKDRFYVQFMKNTGVRNETIDQAAGLFIYYMMEHNWKNNRIGYDPNIKYLCNKEPANIYFMKFLHRVFPNAKFVYVVRDGRDMAYSLISRNRHPKTFERMERSLEYWNQTNGVAYDDCVHIGPAFCKLVKYETLVSQPNETIHEIVDFLKVPWTDDLLDHEKFIGKRISLSNEPIINSIQKKSINNASVGRWTKIQDYDHEVVRKKYTMLKELNYI